MAVYVKHTLKINKAAVDKIEYAEKKALFETADALKGNIKESQVMPFDTGTMQSNMYIARSSDKKKATLITRTPYALRLYYHPEFNFRKTHNANAKGLWLEDYLTGEKKDFCKDAFKKFLKKEL